MGLARRLLRRLHDDSAGRREVALRGVLNVSRRDLLGFGDVAVEKLIADAGDLEERQVPRLARVGAPIHLEVPEQIRLADAQLLVGDRLTLDALELLTQGGLRLDHVRRRRAEQAEEVT